MPTQETAGEYVREPEPQSRWKAIARAIALLVVLVVIAIFVFACNDEDEQTTAQINPYPIAGQGAIEALPCEKLTLVKSAVEEAKNTNDTATLEKWGLAEADKINEQALNGPVNQENGSGDVWQRLLTAEKTCNMQAVNATQEECGPDSSPLKYDPNTDFKVKSDGIDNVTDDLAAVKADPRNLAYRAEHLGLRKGSNNWLPLTRTEGKCLSMEGMLLFAKVEGSLTATTTRVDENGVAPAGYFNTGMGASGPVVNPTAGITGDRSAIVYTLANGDKVYVLKRCANLALPSAPKHYTPVHIPGSGGATPPPGTTTPPPPGTTTPPPPVTTTTPPPPPPVAKTPSEDPYPQGNAPVGGGQNATPGPGVQQPYTPPPAAPYTPPPAPAYTPPPAPPVVTQQPQPSGQPTPTVAPSTQPPNHGTVAPIPGGDFG